MLGMKKETFQVTKRRTLAGASYILIGVKEPVNEKKGTHCFRNSG